MENNFEHIIDNDIYYMHYRRSSLNKPVDFHLHQHNQPEIYFFISGEVDFIVEGSTYTLSPYDAIIVPPYTMHQTVPKIYVPYTRYSFYPCSGFYTHFNLDSSTDIFHKASAQNAKIPSNIIKSTDIINILYKFNLYSDGYKNTDQPILNHLLFEIMYILNSITNYESCNKKNMVIQDIIEYVNEHFKFIENIDEIAQAMNYSKSYISAIFKKHVGISIHDYLIQKRMSHTESLYRNGESLTSACIKSGFSSYNNYAYSYKQLYKKSPKSGLKK